MLKNNKSLLTLPISESESEFPTLLANKIRGREAKREKKNPDRFGAASNLLHESQPRARAFAFNLISCQ